MQDGLGSERGRKIWNKMSYYMILCVSWELNESFRKIVLRHKNNGIHMRRSNPITVDCFVSLD